MRFVILAFLLAACNSQTSTHRPSYVISQSHEAASEWSATPEETTETPAD